MQVLVGVSGTGADGNTWYWYRRDLDLVEMQVRVSGAGTGGSISCRHRGE